MKNNIQLEILISLYNNYLHDHIMNELAEAYYTYKVNNTSSVILLESFNTKPNIFTNTLPNILSTLKPVLLNQDKINFIHTSNITNMWLSTINLGYFCLHHFYLVIPLVIFNIKSLNYTNAINYTYNNLLKLSKTWWCYFMDKLIMLLNIISKSPKMIKYYENILILEKLIKEYEDKHIIYHKVGKDHLDTYEFNKALPLYEDVKTEQGQMQAFVMLNEILKNILYKIRSVEYEICKINPDHKCYPIQYLEKDYDFSKASNDQDSVRYISSDSSTDDNNDKDKDKDEYKNNSRKRKRDDC